jgi:hypothetical protein
MALMVLSLKLLVFVSCLDVNIHESLSCGMRMLNTENSVASISSCSSHTETR